MEPIEPTVPNEEPLMFFAVHPQGLQKYCVDHMKKHTRTLALNSIPFEIDPLDEEEGEESMSRTQFSIGRGMDANKVIECLAMNRMMDELQIVIFEKKLRKKENVHKDESLIEQYFAYFLSRSDFHNKMKQAVALATSYYRFKGIDMETVNYENLQIIATIGTIHKDDVCRQVIQHWNEENKLGKCLAAISERTPNAGWRFEKNLFDRLHHSFELKFHLEYERICVGLVLLNQASIHPYMYESLNSRTLNNVVAEMADCQNDSIVVDLCCGRGDFVVTILSQADCFCIALAECKEDLEDTFGNYEHLERWLKMPLPAEEQEEQSRMDMMHTNITNENKSSRLTSPIARRLDIVLSTIDSVIPTIGRATHVFCNMPLRFEEFTSKDCSDYYSKLFEALTNAKNATILLAVPLNHVPLILAACQAVLPNGEPQYPFDVLDFEPALTEADTVCVFRLKHVPGKGGSTLNSKTYTQIMAYIGRNGPQDDILQGEPEKELQKQVNKTDTDELKKIKNALQGLQVSYNHLLRAGKQRVPEIEQKMDQLSDALENKSHAEILQKWKDLKKLIMVRGKKVFEEKQARLKQEPGLRERKVFTYPDEDNQDLTEEELRIKCGECVQPEQSGILVGPISVEKLKQRLLSLAREQAVEEKKAAAVADAKMEVEAEQPNQYDQQAGNSYASEDPLDHDEVVDSDGLDLRVLEDYDEDVDDDGQEASGSSDIDVEAIDSSDGSDSDQRTISDAIPVPQADNDIDMTYPHVYLRSCSNDIFTERLDSSQNFETMSIDSEATIPYHMTEEEMALGSDDESEDEAQE